MKKILFVIPHMLAGGVEKSLLNLLDYLPRNEFNITVKMVMEEGEFVSLLPDDIEIGTLPLSETIQNEINHGTDGKHALLNAIKRHKILLAASILYRKVMLRDPLAKLSTPFTKIAALEEEYDIAICYHVHCQFIIRYVAEKVKSKYKCAWVHNDFISTNFAIEKYRKEFKVYDRIFCVSKQLVDEFTERLPEYGGKVFLFENILSQKKIEKAADEFIPEEYQGYEGLKVLSIGRLNKQKGFDIAIDICRKLLDSGLEFKWFILGDGELREELTQKIKSNNLSQNFILLGTRINPYPYINNCDLYVQPSRHEGYGIAVAEARLLNKAILCTDFAGAKEQLIDGETGRIVVFDQEDIYLAMLELLKDLHIREEYSMNLRKSNLENYFPKQLDFLLDFFS